MPNANRLTVRLMAVIAQEDCEMIAARTKAALAAAKARGVVLGGYKGGPVVDYRRGVEAVQRQADAFASSVGPIAAGLHAQGKSLRQIAATLVARGIRTPRGGAWSAAAVRAILARIGG